MGDLTLPLQILTGVPEGLLDCEAQALEAALGRSSLLFIEGKCEPPLFVSVLLHGNETSGWDGVRRYLLDNPRPARSIVLFIGNVKAAAQGVRVLPGGQDYNRIWRNAEGPGGALAAAVLAALSDRVLFAAIDLHNNTGHNPYYSVLTDLDPANLGLAFLFSDHAVYVEEPDTVLTRAFAGRCPSVTLETGPVGDRRCAERVYDFIDRCCLLQSVPAGTSDPLQLYRAEARVHIREGISFSFSGESGDSGEKGANEKTGTQRQKTPLILTGGVEAVNFHELSAGTLFGTCEATVDSLLRVLDVEHRDVTSAYFEISNGELRLRKSVVPAMYTTDPFVVRQDCLCYFMQRMN